MTKVLLHLSYAGEIKNPVCYLSDVLNTINIPVIMPGRDLTILSVTDSTMMIPDISSDVISEKRFHAIFHYARVFVAKFPDPYMSVLSGINRLCKISKKNSLDDTDIMGTMGSNEMIGNERMKDTPGVTAWFVASGGNINKKMVKREGQNGLSGYIGIRRNGQ